MRDTKSFGVQKEAPLLPPFDRSEIANLLAARRESVTASKLIIFQINQPPGDALVAEAGIACFARQYPEYQVGVRCAWGQEIYDNHPDILLPPGTPGARVIVLQNNIVHQSHFPQNIYLMNYVNEINRILKVDVKLTVTKPSLYLTEEEKRYPSDLLGGVGRYALVNAGHKGDCPTKYYGEEQYQEIINRTKDIITWVQIGHANDIHPPLDNVINLVGATRNARNLFRLAYSSSDFGLCGITFLHHIYGALGKTCVTLGGGIEGSWFTRYPTSVFFSVVGELSCCSTNGCWKCHLRDCPNVVEGITPLPSDDNSRDGCQQDTFLVSTARCSF
jgi:hypothetical protein